jgi:hypothetical protein
MSDGETPMRIQLSREMLEALKQARHVPPDVQRRIDAATPDAGATPLRYSLQLSDDEAMELSELLQWHVRTDPATGRPTGDSAPYAEVISRIAESQF